MPTDFAPTLSLDLLIAFTVFATVASMTPGPNNAMLMASGANFGFGRTVPHLLGVIAGFLGLLLACGFGLAGLFTAYPLAHEILKWAGAAYMLYLAWKIATSTSLSPGKAAAKPMSFFQAVAFQVVNPKAWAMALGAVTTYAPAQHYVANVLLVTLLFSLLNAPWVTAWTLFGVTLRRFMENPRILRAFNWTMAALLVLTLVPLVLEAVATK